MMSPSEARARILAAPWRAITAEEYADLVEALGSPLTWRPAPCSTRHPKPTNEGDE